MNKSGAYRGYHFGLTNLARIALLGVVAAFASSCASQSGPQVTALPAVDSAVAATVTVRSKPNFSDVKHHHLLTIDGVVAGRFKEDDVKSFQLAEGKHKLEMTCHSRYIRGDNVFPFNYSVVDGRTEMELELLAGDSICLKISFNPLQCAILRETAPSYCE